MEAPRNIDKEKRNEQWQAYEVEQLQKITRRKRRMSFWGWIMGTLAFVALALFYSSCSSSTGPDNAISYKVGNDYLNEAMAEKEEKMINIKMAGVSALINDMANDTFKTNLLHRYKVVYKSLKQSHPAALRDIGIIMPVDTL